MAIGKEPSELGDNGPVYVFDSLFQKFFEFSYCDKIYVT